MKKLLIICYLFLCFFTIKAQSDTSKWIPRINTGISAMCLQYVGGVNSFEVNTLSAITTGVSFQKIDAKNNIKIS